MKDTFSHIPKTYNSLSDTAKIELKNILDIIHLHLKTPRRHHTKKEKGWLQFRKLTQLTKHVDKMNKLVPDISRCTNRS